MTSARLLALPLGVLCAAAAARAQAEDVQAVSAPPPAVHQALERLEAGEVIVAGRALPGSRLREVHVQAVVEAPPRDVWAILRDCGSYARTMNRIKASEDLGPKGEQRLCRVTFDTPLPFPDLTAVIAAIHREEKDRFHRAWEMVEGDYDRNEGSWTLTPFAGDPSRTFVDYHFRVQLRMDIPGPIERWAQDREYPRMIDRLRSEVRGAD